MINLNRWLAAATVSASIGASAAGACIGARIDAANSDGFQNDARCGNDAQTLGAGRLMLQKGGFVELIDDKAKQSLRLRCDGLADKAVELKIKAGADWQTRISASGCEWHADTLACSGRAEPLCVVERVQQLQQKVAVYATVQVRAMPTEQNDSVTIRDWLDKHIGRLDHCRRKLDLPLPVQVPLAVDQGGHFAAAPINDATVNQPLAACALNALHDLPPIAGLSSAYSLDWRLEAP
jgi:hypothetical protein